ncbi:retinal pigment epithelial membrane protein [Apiospora arundinis]
MGPSTEDVSAPVVGDAVVGGSTYKRTAADEETSITEFEDNLTKAAFVDWPIDAGFEGLTEHREPVELVVKGNIPAWAAGSLYRTGPGGSSVEDTRNGTLKISHWFDGLAQMHRFDILVSERSGSEDFGQVRVVYSSRCQADEFVKRIKDAGCIPSASFAQRADPCVGMFGKFMAMFRRRGQLYTNIGVTVNTNMAAFRNIADTSQGETSGHRARASNIFIGSDLPLFAQADPETMEAIAYIPHTALHPKLKGRIGPAHGMQDPETGDYFSFNLELGAASTYRIFQVSADTGSTTILATIASKAAYIHSFFLTEQYVVLCIPVAHYQWNGAKILWKGTLLDSIAPFDESKKCHWFIVDRRNGKGVVARFTSPAAFFFHTSNAFEDKDTGDVICEVVQYPNLSIMRGMYYDILLNRDNKAREFWSDDPKSNLMATLVRYRFSIDDFHESQDKRSELPSPEVILRVSAPHIGDLPTINEAYACRKHRFTYSMASRGLSTLFDSISKIDCETRDVLIWSAPQAHSPSEAIFVPRPSVDTEAHASDEDDGVLLSVVLDGVNKSSYLLCLDAKTMTELGRAECEFAVAMTLHGQHVKGGELGL